MTTGTLRALARISLVALGVALVVALGAVPAGAAPAGPTATLTELRAALDTAGGTLPGYFKTVLKGSTITTISCDVIAVTGAPTDAVDPEGSLIVFESDDPVIQKLGGIASGMSGSPVFVNIGGQDKLIGAVAYGDMFTLGGMGAATPIEAMEAVESLGTDVLLPLDESIATATGMKSGVAIETDILEGYSASAKGMLTLKPLTQIYIGGISPSSSAYKAYAKKAASRGFTVVPLAAELGTGNESYETTLTGGAAVAVLAARGDLWVGALGTVTYENGGNAMLFGHPMTGEGDTALYLHNGWIDTTWASSWFPYKLGVPGKLRGTVTQDRAAGVLGVVGPTPEEVVVSARAHRSQTAKTATSTVGLPSVIANSTSWNWWGINSFAASIASQKLFTVWPAPGSATTLTKVDVTDGTNDYTIVRTNVWDDDYDIPYVVANDVDFITGQIQSIIGAGYDVNKDVRITGVSLESTMTAQRNSATIVDIDVPGGFKRGDNRVRVSLLQRGVMATQTIDVTLTVPADAPLTGEIVASAGGGYFFDEGMEDGEIIFESEMTEDRRTLAQVIADIEDAPKNDVLTVAYVGGESEEAIAEATANTGWVVNGYASKSVYRLISQMWPRTITAGGVVRGYGYVEGATSGMVSIYSRLSGSTTETLIATRAIEPMKDLGIGYDDEGEEMGFFSYVTPRLYKNSVIRVAYSGDKYSVPVDASTNITVRAKVSLAASRRVLARGGAVTLTATIRPADFGGKVYFERYYAGSWRRISPYYSASAGSARYSFRPPAGTVKVRARTLGSDTNAAGTSPIVTLSVR